MGSSCRAAMRAAMRSKPRPIGCCVHACFFNVKRRNNALLANRGDTGISAGSSFFLCHGKNRLSPVLNQLLAGFSPRSRQ